MGLATTTGLDVALRARTRPTSDRRDHLLPLLDGLAPLLPGAALPRGAVVEVAGAAHAGGATTLAFGLLAAATAAGSWCASVGVGDAGILCLAEMGVDLDHLVFVPGPGARWADIAAFLLDGMDAVLVCPPGPVRPGAARRLAARARERKVVLVVLARYGSWPEGPDFHLAVGPGRWTGVGAGDGHLRGRRAEVVTTGRRAASRVMRSELWLPDQRGALVASPVAAPGAPVAASTVPP